MSKKIAFLFPGQGSQSVGMLDPLGQDNRTAPLVLEAAALAQAALGEDLAGLIANGPTESLGLTTNTQPAMLLADVLCYQAYLKLGGAAPQTVAGHSLGEYAALVAAGALTLSEALKLVRIRANAMQTAVPVGQGGMAAVLGLDDQAVRQACAEAQAQGEVVEAVNYNAPSQVVIAGTARGVELACQAAKALGAKRALPLPVSAPFHSSLMKPAAEQLFKALQTVPLTAPLISLVNNIDVAIETDPVRIKDALVRQAHGPVRWVESIQRMASDGIEVFVECGPGKVLAGMVKRIVDLPVYNISDADSAASVIDALKS